MVKFDIDKKGYDIEQVENYINTLSIKYEDALAEQKDRIFAMRKQLDMQKNQLEIYQNKEKQISQALVYAVEKAGQIENGAKKLYDLEIKRINILYNHLKVIMDELEKEYGVLNDNHLNDLIGEFKNGLHSVMEQNKNITSSNIKQELKSNTDNYIKNLLNKMDYVINDKPKKPAIVKKRAEELEKSPIGNRLKELSLKLDGKTADNDLKNTSDIETSAYSKTFIKKSKYPKPNESGFDLEEALNPKEDLEEIMKAFDFYNPQLFNEVN